MEFLTLGIACGDSRDWLASNASSTGTIYVSPWWFPVAENDSFVV